MFGFLRRLANLERRVVSLECRLLPPVPSMHEVMQKMRKQQLTDAKVALADEILRLHDYCICSPHPTDMAAFGQKVKDAVVRYLERTRWI